MPASSVAGRWSGTNLTIDRYDASSLALRAKLNGSARLVVGDGEGFSSVRAEASIENARRLASVIGASALPAAPLTLVADLTWPGSVPDPESLAGRVQMAIAKCDWCARPIAAVDASGERGRWSVQLRGALEGDTSVAGDISVLLDRASLLQSTLAGHFGAQSAKLEDAMRDLRRQGLLPTDLDGVLQGGRATADATLAGTLAAPRLEARLTAESLTLGGVEQIRGEAQVRIDGRAIENHADDRRSFRQSSRRPRDGDGRRRSNPSQRRCATQPAGGSRRGASARMAAIRITGRFRDAARIHGTSAAGGTSVGLRP